jgi:hypothetical protein
MEHNARKKLYEVKKEVNFWRNLLLLGLLNSVKKGYLGY